MDVANLIISKRSTRYGRVVAPQSMYMREEQCWATIGLSALGPGTSLTFNEATIYSRRRDMHISGVPGKIGLIFFYLPVENRHNVNAFD